MKMIFGWNKNTDIMRSVFGWCKVNNIMRSIFGCSKNTNIRRSIFEWSKIPTPWGQYLDEINIPTSWSWYLMKSRKIWLSLDRRTDRRSIGQTTVRSPWPSIETPIHPLSDKRYGWPARSVGGPTICRWKLCRQLRENVVGSTSNGHNS